MADMPSCHTKSANHPNHIGLACWQPFYLAVLFGFVFEQVFAIVVSSL